MADTTTTNETAATTPTGAELVRIVQSGNSRKTTAEVLGHQFRGARVRMTSDDSAVNATSGYTIPFDSAVFDTDTFWSAGTPSRLTIPTGIGITHVEVMGQIHATNGTVSTWSGVIISHRNSGGTLQAQFMNWGFDYGAAHVSSAMTGVITVDDGDYFELVYQEESDASILIEGDHTTRHTFMTLKVVGMEPV